jgi:hypothetical protein
VLQNLGYLLVSYIRYDVLLGAVCKFYFRGSLCLFTASQVQQDLRKSFDHEKMQFQEMLAENKRSFETLLAGLQTENKALFEQSCESDSKLR